MGPPGGDGRRGAQGLRLQPWSTIAHADLKTRERRPPWSASAGTCPRRRVRLFALDILGISASLPIDNLWNGPFMPDPKAELLQGTLDLLILKTLSAGPLHGYAIAQRIQERSEDVLVVEEGSLYPALYRMEEKGWIAAEWGRSEKNRRAKYYSLTRAGRQQLAAETALWERLRRAITLVLQAT